MMQMSRAWLSKTAGEFGLARFTPPTFRDICWSVLPWERLDDATAPDGVRLELRRRGEELLILAGGYDLMSSEDEATSRALADLTLDGLGSSSARVLVGGLGMGFTLRAALDRVGAGGCVEIAELVPAVVEWNRGPLAELAARPLEDPRTTLVVGDVAETIRNAEGRYDAILLDVDNGPIALAHQKNSALYGERGLSRARRALRPGGRLGVWSLSDDAAFTKRLGRVGFNARAHRVEASRKGRGRKHVVWVAERR